MCTMCLADEAAFREYIRDQIFTQYAKPDLVTTELTPEGLLGAIEFAEQDPNHLGYGDEGMETLRGLRERILNAPEDEQQAIVDEAIQVLSDLVSARFAGMNFGNDQLATSTKQTIVEDQEAFPNESLADQLLRAIQHVYFYHETRPQYFYEIVDQDFMDSIGNRMNGYARSSIEHMPHFDSALLVLQEDGAVDAIATIATGVYLEALMAGYYAGSQGRNCMMWQTHELGPVGRLDERDAEIKVPESLAQFEKHKEQE